MNETLTTRVASLMATLAFGCCFEVSDLRADSPDVPEVKFFFFDGTDVEWVVSAEAEAYQQHLIANPTSRTLGPLNTSFRV